MASKLTINPDVPPSETPPQPTVGIQDIPPEMMLKIFGTMKGWEASQVRSVCRLWQELIDDESLWKHFLAQEFHRVEPNRAKEHYQVSFLFNRNLTKGIYTTSVTQITDDIPSFVGDGHVCIKDHQLISGALNSRIKVWDLKSGDCKKTLIGHAWSVTSLVLTKEGNLISTDTSGTIKIWNLETWTCTNTFSALASPVSSNIILHKGSLIAGYSNGSIKIWDLQTGLCKNTLSDYKAKVHSLVLTKEGKLISGSADGSIRIWNLENGDCETLEENKNGICSLILSREGKLIASYEGGTIKMWNLDSGLCEMGLKEHYTAADLHLSNEGKLVSNGSLGPIKVWDLEKCCCERTLEGNQSHFTSLCFTLEGKLIAGDWGGTIKVWDIERGVCEMTINTHKKSQFLSLTNDGKLIIGDSTRELIILDFKASHSAVFEELAELFEETLLESQIDPKSVMERFLRMPAHARGQIYGELDKILKSVNDTCSGSAEHAFHDQEGLSSTPGQKAQAIRNYLSQKSI